MDALPPSAVDPAPPPGYVYAPTDIYPRGERQAKLCATASTPDYLYIGTLLALNAGVVVLMAEWSPAKYSGVGSYGGPALLGLTWGATIGGTYLSLPKCDPHWIGDPPPEGNVRTNWPLVLSLAILGGATAPVFYGIVNGPLDPKATTFERQMHLVSAGVGGAVGTLVPYLLPPKTWRAAKELEKLRVSAGPTGAFISYGATF